jgi:hypothetical protein
MVLEHLQRREKREMVVRGRAGSRGDLPAYVRTASRTAIFNFSLLTPNYGYLVSSSVVLSIPDPDEDSTQIVESKIFSTMRAFRPEALTDLLCAVPIAFTLIYSKV